VEYAAVSVLGAGVLAYVLVFHVLGCFSTPVSNQAEVAQLSLVMGPLKTWEEGSSVRLKSVELKIKNMGPIAAEGITVTGIFRGVPLQLTGQPSLQVGEMGTYSTALRMGVLSSDSIEFSIQCATCAPFVFPK
jgi:hypothetical protein